MQIVDESLGHRAVTYGAVPPRTDLLFTDAITINSRTPCATPNETITQSLRPPDETPSLRDDNKIER